MKSTGNPTADRLDLIARNGDGRPHARKIGQSVVVWFEDGDESRSPRVIEIHAPWRSHQPIWLRSPTAVRNLIRALEEGLAWMERRR